MLSNEVVLRGWLFAFHEYNTHGGGEAVSRQLEDLSGPCFVSGSCAFDFGIRSFLTYADWSGRSASRLSDVYLDAALPDSEVCVPMFMRGFRYGTAAMLGDAEGMRLFDSFVVKEGRRSRSRKTRDRHTRSYMDGLSLALSRWPSQPSAINCKTAGYYI